MGITLSKNQECIEFDKSTKIKGFQGDEVFSYLELRFDVCKFDGNPQCVPRQPTPNEKVTDVSSPSGLKASYNFFQDLVIEFSFIEAGVEIGNFKNPILYNLNTNNQVRANLYSEKIYDFYLGELNIETKTGWFVEN